mmetsp:Transcript_101437/g.257958  ORF Transcript_101437/g.257958 Transcript_101437/m.257958 type:complete len:283 (-) Transcript_101437:141-989(-)
MSLAASFPACAPARLRPLTASYSAIARRHQCWSLGAASRRFSASGTAGLAAAAEMVPVLLALRLCAGIAGRSCSASSSPSSSGGGGGPRARRRRVQSCAGPAAVAAAEGGAGAGEDSGAAAAEPQSRWQRARGSIQRNGVGYFFAYGLVSNVNGCLLLAMSWALFVRTRGVSPVLADPALPLVGTVLKAFFRPSSMNPKFLLYYGAVYLSVGSIMRPLRIGLAAGLVPVVRRFFDFVQDRLRCPRPLTWVVAFVSLVVFSLCCFPVAVLLCCFVLRVPVLTG